MTIGTGIAIAGVLIFVGMAWMSNSVTSLGSWVALFAALLATWFIAG